MQFHWYLSIWYFDMPMHFLGGLWLGLTFIWILKVKEISLSSIIKISVFVFFVGILWELFEIIINETITGDSFDTLDTISDLSFDLTGGFIAMLYFIKRIMLIDEYNIHE